MNTDNELRAIIRMQVRMETNRQCRAGKGASKARQYAVGCSVFNHGVQVVKAALGLRMPAIRSIFFRPDCFDRSQLAARQMLR